MTLRRVIAPAVSPVSVAEIKAHTRVDEDAEDSLISGYIDAATGHFDGEGTLGRAIISQSWAQWFGPTPGRVRLLMGPFIQLTSIEYFDSENTLQTASLGDFETWLDGDFVTLKPRENAQWPSGYARPDAFKVTYVAGFGAAASDVPASIRHAIMMAVAHFYEHRMAVDDVKMLEVPMGVEWLINNERVGWYG